MTNEVDICLVNIRTNMKTLKLCLNKIADTKLSEYNIIAHIDYICIAKYLTTACKGMEIIIMKLSGGKLQRSIEN